MLYNRTYVLEKEVDIVEKRQLLPARRRWERACQIRLAQIAQEVARKVIRRRGEWPSRKAKWGQKFTIKWQCLLDHEESAALDVIRVAHFGGISRYALVRALLVAMIEEGEEEFCAEAK